MRPVLICLVMVSMLFMAGAVSAQVTFGEQSQKQMMLANLASMPLAFTENRGQWDQRALFRAQAGGATFFFCKDEVAYLFSRDTDELIEAGMPHSHDMLKGMPDKFNHPRYKKESMVLRARFVGANPNPKIISEDRLSYNCNYFLGNIPSKWATDAPNYSSITYKEIYPGIDLKYHGDGHLMKYDFIVNPGADISQIRIKYDGVENVAVTANGDLEAQTSFGPIHENIPSVYQEIGEGKREIMGRYIILEPGVFGFEVDDYNPSYPLLIDPELIYSTYLGGNSLDYGYAIAVDASGSAYITGVTSSTDFPTQNPYSGSLNGYWDVFVTKLAPAGNSLVYSTYLGGNNWEWALGIAVDASGNAYITGETESTDFPTQNPYDASWNGVEDAFVTKLAPAGNSLVYSTYLGGNDWDRGYGIAVDASGNAYITGYTESTDFPIQNPYQTDQPGYDVFVTKIAPAGNSLIYSTYLGGSSGDYGYEIAVDASGSAYITGVTSSTDFPTQNPYDGSLNGSYDVFVTKLAPAGNSLIYSTYLGGNGDDEAGRGIAVDASGNAYITGYTESTDFPTQNPYQTDQPGYDAFVTKLAPAGNSLVYSTYLGGNSEDIGHFIAVNASGSAYITGETGSTDFPIQNPYQTDQPQTDVFVTKLAPAGNSLVYSTYLGGDSLDYGHAIAVDASGNAYITGYTESTDFPTLNSYQTDQPDRDVFVTKLGVAGPFPCDYLPGDVNNNGDANGVDVTYAVNYLKGIGPEPPVECSDCPNVGETLFAAGDVNGNCQFNGVDVSYYVNYLKGIGPALAFCPDCPPAAR